MQQVHVPNNIPWFFKKTIKVIVILIFRKKIYYWNNLELMSNDMVKRIVKEKLIKNIYKKSDQNINVRWKLKIEIVV